jgi:hypothetical protein
MSLDLLEDEEEKEVKSLFSPPLKEIKENSERLVGKLRNVLICFGNLLEHSVLLGWTTQALGFVFMQMFVYVLFFGLQYVETLSFELVSFPCFNRKFEPAFKKKKNISIYH